MGRLPLGHLSSNITCVKRKATLAISEGSTILRGLAELRLIDQGCQTGLKSTLCGKADATLDTKASLVFFLQVKKVERGLGTRLAASIRCKLMDQI